MRLLFEPTRRPREHQFKALSEADGREAFAYLMEMGTGKSKVFVDELVNLYLQNTVNRALVLAGKGSYEEWLSKHLPENIPDDFPVLAHLWEGGDTKREQRGLRYLMEGPPVLRVLIVNTEALAASKTAATVCMNFVRSGKCMVVVDESTMIKNEDADRTQVAVALGSHAVVRRIMTGSPITKSPLDLWGQFLFLGVQESLGSNWFSFRARYCTLIKRPIPACAAPGSTGGQRGKNALKITGYRNLERLEQILKRHSFRVRKDECLDLPPKIYQHRLVELTQDQWVMYTSMLRIATAEVEAGLWASAKNAVARLTRLHQIVCGHIRDEAGTLHRVKSNRLAAMDETIEEMGEKILIWCSHREDVNVVLEHLAEKYSSRRAVRYDGSVSGPDRALARDAFQSGDADFFVATTPTGGRGITLTACSHVIYFSNSFDLEHRMQSEDRTHRDGQVRPVVYVDLIAKGTVEERIVRTLREKKLIADQIVGDGAREWLEWAA